MGDPSLCIWGWLKVAVGQQGQQLGGAGFKGRETSKTGMYGDKSEPIYIFLSPILTRQVI